MPSGSPFPCLDVRTPGHASASANFEFYLATYFLWTVFYRRWTPPGGNVEALMAGSRSGCSAFWHDVGEGVALLWILFNVRGRPRSRLLARELMTPVVLTSLRFKHMCEL